MNFALEIETVSKFFGSFCAVDEVSMQVRRGEFLTLLGPSGCGKTTLLRMVAGFETPSQGEIRIAGVRVNERAPYARPIGMVFQNLALFPHMSVGDNVGYGLNVRSLPHTEINRRVAEALELVGLKGFERRRINELSGGQKQRVALSRALVIRPEVLLLDEPLSALDLKLRRQLQRELKQIQQRVGTTFIFVTHDQEEALAMSDRIAVVNEGKIEQIGTPQAVYSHPATPFVARFVGDTNFLVGQVRAVIGGRADVNLLGFDRSISVPVQQNLSVGGRVGLSVRPEHIEVSASPTPRSPLAGAILERSYVGANTRYAIALEQSTEEPFIALVPNSHVAMPQFESGQRVHLGWADENISLVPVDQSAISDATGNEKAASGNKSQVSG